jgi:hypothetical protein
MNKETRRAIIQPLGHVSTNANSEFAAARTGLLRLAEVEHLVLSRQVSGTLATAAATLLDDHFLGLVFSCCGRWLRLGFGEAIKERRSFDTLGTPAEVHPRQIVNVGLLLVDEGT